MTRCNYTSLRCHCLQLVGQSQCRMNTWCQKKHVTTDSFFGSPRISWFPWRIYYYVLPEVILRRHVHTLTKEAFVVILFSVLNWRLQTLNLSGIPTCEFKCNLIRINNTRTHEIIANYRIDVAHNDHSRKFTSTTTKRWNCFAIDEIPGHWFKCFDWGAIVLRNSKEFIFWANVDFSVSANLNAVPST